MSWNGFKFGPLMVIDASNRQMLMGNRLLKLGEREFSTLLKLMTAVGGLVSHEYLEKGYKPGSVRIIVCRLRKRLKKLGLDITVGTHFYYRLQHLAPVSFCPPGWTRTNDHGGISSALLPTELRAG